MAKAWTYDQSTGVLTAPDGRRWGGYSGRGEGLNNPAMDHVRARGPIPRGRWDMGANINGKFQKGKRRKSMRTGPAVFDLVPQRGTITHGRSAFQIHGDNNLLNFTASSGCIIVRREARDAILDSKVFDLVVVA